jgi:hypothetical protein
MRSLERGERARDPSAPSWKVRQERMTTLNSPPRSHDFLKSPTETLIGKLIEKSLFYKPYQSRPSRSMSGPLIGILNEVATPFANER